MLSRKNDMYYDNIFILWEGGGRYPICIERVVMKKHFFQLNSYNGTMKSPFS